MSVEPVLGETITIGMFTSATDGSLLDADSLPTCEVMEAANDTPVLTPTVVKRTGRTGQYRVDIVMTTANGFEVGKSYEVHGLATVSGKSGGAVLDRFILRGYSVDGVNIVAVGGQTAATSSSGITLDPAERIAIAVAVKTDTGHDTTSGSIGKQSKDMYDTMVKYGGLIITGKVNATPTPSPAAFAITLDSPLPTGKTVAGLIGQYLTIRAGGAQTEANAITGCVIQSPTVLLLTFTAPGVFSASPNTDDPVTISE